MEKHTLIFVDDDVLYLRLVRSIVEERGVIAHYANSGTDALEILRNNRCATMVTDLNMPGMDGLKLSVLAKELLPDLQIILATGDASLKVFRLAAKAGILRVIDKPSRADQIHEIIKGSRPEGLSPEFRTVPLSQQKDGAAKKMNLTVLTLLMLVLTWSAPWQAGATLGEGSASLAKDRRALSANKTTSSSQAHYTVQEITSDATLVREYLTDSGVVFGIAWNGLVHPDLTTLLGSYASEYQDARQKTARGRGQRHLRVRIGWWSKLGGTCATCAAGPTFRAYCPRG
jgi:CheY-like chemotaxis protein